MDGIQQEAQSVVPKSLGGNFTLSINELAKTIQGKQLIESGRPFCLGGQVFQGFNGAVISCNPKQLSDAEVENLIDIDDSVSRVTFIRRQRAEGLALAKSKELDERRAKKRKEELDELQLTLTRRQIEETLDGSDIKVQRDVLQRKLAELEAKLAEQPTVFKCGECGKEFDSDRALQGHKSGANHR